MTFSLKIHLGNDSMLTGFDLANAIRVTANALENDFGADAVRKDSGLVFDLNGNIVGKWEVK
jgi:hypothetical protein